MIQEKLDLLGKSSTFLLKNLDLPHERAISEMQIIIYISQPEFRLNPFDLEQDTLLKGLINANLHHAYTFGGSWNTTLILEYSISPSILEDPQSEWNRLLGKIHHKFPFLELNMCEKLMEEHFLNEQVIFSKYWRNSEFLLQNRIDTTNAGSNSIISHIINYRLGDTNDYESATNPQWQFWEILGYNMTVAFFLKNPAKKRPKLKILFQKFPMGEIVYLKDKANQQENWLVILRLKENFALIMQNLLSTLNRMHVQYLFSPLIPLEMYESSMYMRRVMALSSQTPPAYSPEDGDILEIPLFKYHAKYECYSPQERILFHHGFRQWIMDHPVSYFEKKMDRNFGIEAGKVPSNQLPITLKSIQNKLAEFFLPEF
jgi:hypothetical protein